VCATRLYDPPRMYPRTLTRASNAPAFSRVTLEIRTHLTRESLAALAPDWDALVEAAPRPSPYLLYAWCDEWLGGPGSAARVAVVSAHRGERLVGLLPTCTVKRAGLRVLAFIGDRGCWSADMLLAPGEPGSTASALLAAAIELPFQLAAFTGLPGGSLLLATSGDRLREIERAEGPVLELPDGWEAAYAAKASSQRRSRDRKRERQLEAAGAFELVIADTPEATEAVFDDVMTLHELRWGHERDGSEFGTPEGARSQRAALRRLAGSGHAGIVLLRLDGRPIGFQIWLTVGDVMYLHRSGVDPTAMKFSPGLIAMRRAIAHGSSELGVRHVEMQGAGEQYKLDLATRLLPMHDGYGLPRNVAGRLVTTSLIALVQTRRRLRRIEPLRRIYMEGPKALRRKHRARSQRP
jgi:CelD/BcsL family acetyltransferase involved in cellulose biosynthesis